MSRQSTSVKPCPVCETGQMHYAIQNVTIKRRGLSAKVKGVAGWHCDHCDEIDFDLSTDSAQRWASAGDALVMQARQQIGQNLREARIKLNMTQAQASKISGGGHNAFSRYETGEAKPVAGVLFLFELLSRHPELMTELNEIAMRWPEGMV